MSSNSRSSGCPSLAPFSSARLTCASCQLGLQGLQLATDLLRQVLAEPVEVLADLLELGAQLVLVDVQQLLDGLLGDLQALGVQRALRGDEADRRLAGLPL